MDPYGTSVKVLTWLTHDVAPLAVVGVIAFWKPRLGSPFFFILERWFARFARHRRIAVLGVGIFSLALCAGMSLLILMPLPWVFDEFSYLLAADTFAHGRLANPTHPMWEHLETFHVLQHPTYESQYPPAQGLMLALGQVLCGLPIAGAWLSTALASAAICWMLMAWMPPRWALLGGFLAAIHPMLFTWSQSYWGGSVAVMGGALLVGGFMRVLKGPRCSDSLWMALGMATLANSRPFEGMILTLLVTSALMGWLVIAKNAPALMAVMKRVLLPVAVVLAMTGVWIGYYNYRVTGNPILMPEVLNMKQKAIAPAFVWQEPRAEPNYRHEIMRKHYTGYSLKPYLRQRTFSGYVSELGTKIKLLTEGYVLNPGYLTLTPLEIPATLQLGLLALGLPWLLRNQRIRLILILSGAFMATVILVETWMQPHYTAPVTALMVAIGLQSIRQLRLWRWRTRGEGKFVPSGLFAMRALVLLLIAAFAFHTRELCKSYPWNAWAKDRARVHAELNQMPGHHLVIVRYSPQHSPAVEWVFNQADIDNAKVVWAREMGETENKRLLDYFKGRRVWLLEADTAVPKPIALHE